MESFSDPSSGLRVVVACYIGAYFLLIIFSYFRFGVQSHHVFSIAKFRVVSLDLTFIDIALVWCSEPPCLLDYDVQSHLSQLDVHSYQFSLAFRATVSSQFGVGSHGLSSAFKIIISSLVWLSKPPSLFSLAFRAVCFILAFDDTIFL